MKSFYKENQKKFTVEPYQNLHSTY